MHGNTFLKRTLSKAPNYSFLYSGNKFPSLTNGHPPYSGQNDRSQYVIYKEVAAISAYILCIIIINSHWQYTPASSP